MIKQRLLHKGIFRTLFFVFLVLGIVTIQSCYHYRIINTDDDAGTEYQSKVVWSYAWGLWKNPQNLQVPNCPENAALNQVEVSKNFGQSLLTIITIGIVSPAKVKWKCHKPCPREPNDNDGL